MGLSTVVYDQTARDG